MAYNKERYRTLKMVAYYMLLTIWYLLSLLPLWVHYLLSDLLYLIVYKIFGYRKAVVKVTWLPHSQRNRKTSY